MALDPKQERYVRRFFPGLIEAVTKLGAGEFESDRPELRPMGDGVRGVGLHLNYNLADGFCVRIKISSRLKFGEAPYVPAAPTDLTPVDLNKWERIHYALHYDGSRDHGHFRSPVTSTCWGSP